ncbi:hypothetical protein LZ554_002244 [Drepanopeziza brunnea f. sp. 'monogermtubi']|nr:hypothetical protein LZ554_002244 [Drepanopeziza brunnea f. sp. 'monogermtubi']
MDVCSENTLEGESSYEIPPLDDRHHHLDRATLCLPHYRTDAILHAGDEAFQASLQQYFSSSAESNASERLVDLKAKLRGASTHDFWRILMEEMCDVTGSQCGFVAKRMLVDDQDSAVKMPPLGEEGSCLIGVACYVNDGADVKELHREYRYNAYGTPCAHMRHDKVLIVPERLDELTPNNPHKFPWKQSEAYIALPLFFEGKCFAHFGMIWSLEGSTKRTLSWSFIEMFMHSLEDMILQRILEGRGLVKEMAPPKSTPAKTTPLAAIMASQSLKPYARSLSHELRTPMQGVVGMLDIMYSTILDSITNQQSEHLRSVFSDLKNHIEIVQESSRRAIEAADNLVHAYDLNMQMPETPLTPTEEQSFHGIAVPETPLPQRRWPSAGSLPSLAGTKHGRTDAIFDIEPPPMKKRPSVTEAETPHSYSSDNCNYLSNGQTGRGASGPAITLSTADPSFTDMFSKARFDSKHIASAVTSSTHRRIETRHFMRGLVNEALWHGRPISETREETELGERIHVRSIGSRGEVQDRIIQLEISADVPQVIITEEQHLQFAIQKLVDNAIKFTEHGTITIMVSLSTMSEGVEISVRDNGCGISEESKSNLFKPHFQEDASMSRSRDGLGLSLFNAKAHVRRNLGGDVTLERSCTHGPMKGSEFLIRLPLSALEKGKSDTPIVGTSPLSGYQTPRPSPLLGPMMEFRRPTSTPCKGLRQPWAKSAPRKRAVFNPNLASDYPLRILIAEDNAINRNVAIGSLGKLGYDRSHITLAFDGLEAIKQYKASLNRPPAERFNAVLMDIWMPNLDGYKAAAEIMKLAGSHGEPISIIAVTADITEDSVDRARASGMHGFLAKPYKVLDLEQLIIEHFG